MRVKRFDLGALERDRDQLWAEAAVREATGVSIRLDPKLWPDAAAEQAQRLTNDPYFEELQNALGGMEGKISSTDVWTILDVRAGARTQDQNTRVGAAMRLLGWVRPNKSKLVKIGGKAVMGYVKGEQPWTRIVVCRDKEYGLTVNQGDDQQPTQTEMKLEDAKRLDAQMRPADEHL